MARGIASSRIQDTPIAVLDFETTGLNPGTDRVVEVSVFRIEPDGEARLAFDTMVNPKRPMAATEIHGITDQDVAGAPEFEAIAGGLANVLSGCMVAAYNVYFDMRFLDYEFRRAGILQSPPHFCLMYLRPMLGLGARCRLGAACIDHGISYNESHIAAEDAQASAQLMQEVYLKEINDRGIETFADLGRLKDYKFVRSFRRKPLQAEAAAPLAKATCLKSRVVSGTALMPGPVTPASEAVPIANKGLGIYWEALKTVVADLVITDEEISQLKRTREQLDLKPEQVRVLHARAFASVILQFIDDQWLDDNERRKLKRLHQCLSLLGWAPGE